MWQLADKKLSSRLLLGTAQYPSLSCLQDAIKSSATEIVTVSLRRQNAESNQSNHFWDVIKESTCHILPNTAGCRSAQEAITVAQMARELFNTNWIKLEVIGDEYTLQPDPFELVKAAEVLIAEGFEVFPYCTDDLILCQRLADAGCRILMPWAAPIGSGRGLLNPYALSLLRARFPKHTLIVDAGIGKASHATQAMELGFDGVLLNSAVSLAKDPVHMAEAFKHAVQAGRAAYEAGMIPERNMANASTPLIDTLFWHQEKNFVKRKFPSCGPKALGLYPVVDSVEWLKKLLPLGVSTIQLRIKNKDLPELEEAIKEGVELAQHYQARLFINDYWELAIKHGAYGVHLGQEDLVIADIDKIYQAGLRLGVSTHSADEINNALNVDPSYLAFGPIYPTTSKVMPFSPQGLQRLQTWCQSLTYPVVAIGGINEDRMNEVLATGVNGVAMISAITQAEDPIAMTQQLLKFFNQEIIHA